MSHVFISYSTQNSDYAYQLAEKLRAEGFDIWIDNRQLRSSDNWWESIVRALRGCAAFIVIMSPEARNSRWVQREVTLADNWRKPTFPLLLAGENWEIFVLTQFENVALPPTSSTSQHAGKIPPASFFDKLEEFAPRQRHQGANIRTTGDALAVEIDAEIAKEIANPPTVEPEISPAELSAQIVVSIDTSDTITFSEEPPPVPVTAGHPPAVSPPGETKPSRSFISRRRTPIVVITLIVLIAVGAFFLSNSRNYIPNPILTSEPSVTAIGGGEGQVIFSSNNKINLIDLTSKNVRELSTQKSSDPFPVWNPDGQSILYSADGTLYKMDADGRNIQDVSPSSLNSEDSAWSHDGQKIAISVSPLNAKRDIYVMNTDGSSLIPITTNSHEDRHPSWSPDGKKLVFHSDRSGNYALYTVDVPCGTPATCEQSIQPLGSNGLILGSFPAWSPDGMHIAFNSNLYSSSNPESDFEIYVIDTDGTNLKQLTHNGIDELHPAWSLDGTQLAFQGDTLAGDFEIFILNIASESISQLTDNTLNDTNPAWRPVSKT